jgi:hypothetical protein
MLESVRTSVYKERCLVTLLRTWGFLVLNKDSRRSMPRRLRVHAHRYMFY